MQAFKEKIDGCIFVLLAQVSDIAVYPFV